MQCFLQQVSENFVLIWWFGKVAFIFLYSALNPIIYGLTNRTFRRAFRNSIILGAILRLSEDKNNDDQVAKKPQMPRIMTFSHKPGEKGILPYRTKNRYNFRIFAIHVNFVYLCRTKSISGG